MIAPEAGERRPRRARASTCARKNSPRPPLVKSQSLLDVVDTLIDKGLALDAEVVLGLANIDLVYLRVGALLAAADRVLDTKSDRRRRPPTRRPTEMRPSSGNPEVPDAVATSPSGVDHAEPVPARLNAVAPDDTSRSVIRLVLTLVEFVRQLLERQAVRRVREQTLTPEEIERLGTALMRLESTVHELAERHGLDPADLNLDLGPLGTLR
jgi:hypothetical protein